MIRIDGAHLRVKRIRQSRNGAFCVADLSTDIGEFKVKDPLLDQFDEGEYQATVWISEIYLGKLCKTNESRRCSSPTAVHAVLTQIFC